MSAGPRAAVIRVEAIRLVRSVGYRGRRPLQALGAVLLLGAGLVVLAGARLAAAIADVGITEDFTRNVATGLVVTLAEAGGLIVLLSVLGVRSGGRRLRRVLGALPYRRSEAESITLIPALVLAALESLAIVGVGTAAVVALGHSMPLALLWTGTGHLIGLGLVAICALAVRLAARRSSWLAGVEMPTLVLVAMAVEAAILWASGSVYLAEEPPTWGRFALLPVVVADVFAGGARPLVVAAVGMGCALAVAAWMRGSRDEPYAPGKPTLWRWRPGPGALLWLEVTRLARHRALMSNLVAGVLISVLAVAALLRLEPTDRAVIGDPVIHGAALVLPVALTMVRGTSAPVPPQLVLGQSPARWAARVVLAAALLLLPPALLVAGTAGAVAGWSPGRIGGCLALTTLGAAWACAVSWLFGGAGDAPLTQAVAAVLYVLLALLIAWLVGRVAPDGGPAWFAAVGWALAIGALTPPLLEVQAWDRARAVTVPWGPPAASRR